MAGPLSSEALRTIVRTWAARTGHHGVPEPGGTFLSVGEDPTMHVVDLPGTAVLVRAPAPAVEILQGVPLDELVDDGTLLRWLAPLRPRVRARAALSYAESTPPPRPGHRVAVRPADAAATAALRDTVSADEWGEGGLDGMSPCWVAVEPDGSPAAGAGYEQWAGGVAHIGVLASPAHRGAGRAGAVARVAVRAAITDGLVAQWRHRVGNTGSDRLACRLGFERLGRQTVLEVDVGRA